MPDLEIITTSDGSHSILNTSLGETYHSIHGAVQESKHVFIRNGLEYFLSKSSKKEINILEIGFGTGLNALLTLMHPNPLAIKIYYESWEAYPLEDSILRNLNYGTMLDAQDEFIKIAEASWDQRVAITTSFTLRKCRKDILHHSFESDAMFDLIYFDAFAPSKQAEMWSKEILEKVVSVLAPEGVWVTYCAKGQVKRDLKSLSLHVEALEGPPGKMEMTRASFLKSD